MNLLLTHKAFLYVIECTIRIFRPNIKLTYVSEDSGDAAGLITAEYSPESGFVRASLRAGSFTGRRRKELAPTHNEKEAEHLLSEALFLVLCEYHGKTPPWGMLTGVRPLNLYRSFRYSGLSDSEVLNLFENKYHVFPLKSGILKETFYNQSNILRESTKNTCSLYINIPFCPTRCIYCSFISHEINKVSALIPEYIARLKTELLAVSAVIQRFSLELKTIYIGGGTPTSLEAAQLSELLTFIKNTFDFAQLREYTVEAGRPDTITAEKLGIIKKAGVTRISINPQTLNDNILAEIGRSHTSGDTVAAFNLARSMGFNFINMDLITALPHDSRESFLESLDKVISLSPENITIHALTLKRASALKNSLGKASAECPADTADYYEKVKASGYLPYYLYRQKGSVFGAENIGFAKPGFIGAYNVYIMEEMHTILAAGAGAVTKLCGNNKKIKRVYNFKNIYEYIKNFEELLNRKKIVSDFYETYR